MFLNKLLKVNWDVHQMTRFGHDTGVITLTAALKGRPEPLYLEVGWYVKKKAGEKALLVRNPKHAIVPSFPIETDPENYMTLETFVDQMQWQKFVAKALPEDLFK